MPASGPAKPPTVSAMMRHPVIARYSTALRLALTTTSAACGRRGGDGVHDHRPARDFDEALVLAAHASGLAAREHDGGHVLAGIGDRLRHHATSVTAPHAASGAKPQDVPSPRGGVPVRAIMIRRRTASITRWCAIPRQARTASNEDGCVCRLPRRRPEKGTDEGRPGNARAKPWRRGPTGQTAPGNSGAAQERKCGIPLISYLVKCHASLESARKCSDAESADPCRYPPRSAWDGRWRLPGFGSRWTSSPATTLLPMSTTNNW